MTCLSGPTAKYLFKVKRVKSRKTILTRRLWSRELCHAAFIFNFEHIQQINLIFLLVTLNMYLSVGHWIKSTKQLKFKLNNNAVSLKHAHVT